MDRNQLYNDAETSLRLALDGRQSSIWTAIPAIVDSVNFSQMTCEVIPAIQGSVEQADGTFVNVNLPKLVDVPICFPSAGGFILTMPLQANDEVLVIFSSRCIDAWWQSGGIQRAMELRMHDLSDGFAIPGPKSLPRVVGGISTTAAQLRNNAGTIYLQISNTGVTILGNLSVTGTITSTGDVVGNGVSLGNHTHPIDVPSTPFLGNTGAPN